VDSLSRLASSRLASRASQTLVSEALALEAHIKQHDFSSGNLAALASARLLASSTLLQESTHTHGTGYALLRWQAANQKLAELLASGVNLSGDVIKELHRVLSPEQDSSLRREQVYGGHTRYPEASALLDSWSLFNERLAQTESEAPITRAAMVYQWLVTWHFFSDANGRLARLSADFLLLKAGLLPLSFPSSAAAYVSALHGEHGVSVDEALTVTLLGLRHSLAVFARQLVRR
jgi:Fic family protein